MLSLDTNSTIHVIVDNVEHSGSKIAISIQDNMDAYLILNSRQQQQKVLLVKILYNVQRYYIFCPIDQLGFVPELRGKMNNYWATHYTVFYFSQRICVKFCYL